MIDTRFYELLGPAEVGAIAGALPVEGDAKLVLTGVASLEGAGPQDLCYFDARVGTKLTAAPGACVVRPAAIGQAQSARTLIVSDHPRAAFARLASKLVRAREHDGEVPIHPSARMEEGARIGPGAVIGQGAEIGAGALIGAGAVIGPGVAIGRDTRIGANAVVVFALVGDGVTILAGAVVGETGFGVASDAAGRVDVPHFGRVIVQDRAVIGANTTIDRGVFDDTIIAEEAKIDNLCQIGHNVVVGRGVLIASFGGISGSAHIGDGVMMGGRVGVTDHRTIGAGAVLAAGSAVLQDVPAGETWAGYPAKPIRKWMRETTWLSRRAHGARDG